MAVTQDPGFDVSDMVSVHNVLREANGAAEHLVQGAIGDPERSALVANFYENVLAFLHVHHEGEDELVWPALLERCPKDAELINRVAAQHLDVVTLVDLGTEQARAWGAGDAAAAAGLLSTLAAISGVLDSHLRAEETEILPLCAAHMTAGEWAALPAHGMSHFEGDKPWLVVGLVRRHMNPDQREAMLAAMPPPAREGWLSAGEAIYDAYIGELGL